MIGHTLFVWDARRRPGRERGSVDFWGWSTAKYEEKIDEQANAIAQVRKGSIASLSLACTVSLAWQYPVECIDG